MGQLKPGIQYIYEKADGITYAREFGAEPSTRQAIGWNYDMTNPDFDPRNIEASRQAFHERLKEDKMWGEIRREAKTNITLQRALDRVIMIYKLSKEKYE